jgi:hypothetical protein
VAFHAALRQSHNDIKHDSKQNATLRIKAKHCHAECRYAECRK